jgi:uncharacterized protein YggE
MTLIKKSVTLWMVLSLMSLKMMGQVMTAMPEQRKVEVTGHAEMEVVPDEIFVTITVQEFTENKKKTDINDVRKGFLTACEKAGIVKENISIQGMNGYNGSGWYWTRKKKDVDFVGSATYVIKFSSGEQIERLMSLLDDKGTQNMFVSSTSHSKMEDFKKQMKIKALQDAKAKATYLCESVGEKAGKVLMIKEGEGSSFVQPMMMEKRMMVMADSNGGFEGSGLEFQKIKITMDVQAQFAIQ